MFPAPSTTVEVYGAPTLTDCITIVAVPLALLVDSRILPTTKSYLVMTTVGAASRTSAPPLDASLDVGDANDVGDSESVARDEVAALVLAVPAFEESSVPETAVLELSALMITRF